MKVFKSYSILKHLPAQPLLDGRRTITCAKVSYCWSSRAAANAPAPIEVVFPLHLHKTSTLFSKVGSELRLFQQQFKQLKWACAIFMIHPNLPEKNPFKLFPISRKLQHTAVIHPIPALSYSLLTPKNKGNSVQF